MSFKYFEDIGAKVADNKCFTFASDKDTRKYLQNNKWRHNGKYIPLKNFFRDLGAHMNFTKTKNGATLTKRIKSAIAMCKRLKWLKLSNNNKYKIINSNIIPAALYGVETTHVSTTAIDELRTAIADVMGPKSPKRSLDMAFNLSDKNKGSDPKAHVLVRRIMELRRMMSKDQETYVIAQSMVSFYNDLDNTHLSESISVQETEQ